MADPDARPIRKGKLGKPNEFGYVVQVAEVTANTRRGARGFVLPAATAGGNPGENRLLAQTAAELARLSLRPREVALDGGFVPGPTGQTPAALAPARVFIAGRAEPGSRGTRKRLAGYRTGCEGAHQPPQTRLRTATQPPEGRPGPADLDRLGDPGLQPRHPRHPRHLTGPGSTAGPQVTLSRPPHPPFIRGK
jgi:IS5 family transposase